MSRATDDSTTARTVAVDEGWPWLNRASGQQPYLSGYRPVVSDRGMVTAPHPLAAQAGLDVLRSGGNAVDAAVAVSAMLMVVTPMQCSPGGDAFWLIAADGDEPIALNASGRAPEAADPDELVAKGYTSVPSRSPWAVTVPGVVRGWVDALARHGTRPLRELLAPAVDRAERGVRVTHHLRASIAVASEVLRASHLGRTTYLSDGVPALYSRLTQHHLADALREVARTDGDSVYSGRIAEGIVDAVTGGGGWLAGEDLAAHASEWTVPLQSRTEEGILYAPPPNSQGLVLLEAMALVTATAEDTMTEAQRIHLRIEALRAARADNEIVGIDPDLAPMPAAALLQDDMLSQRFLRYRSRYAASHWSAAESLDGTAQAAPTGRVRDGDTAHFAVVDADRMVVSCTQSIFDDFGSGVAVEEFGFMLQSRGSSFSLQPGAANRLAGGRRPPHSLSPGLVRRDGRNLLAFGSMGGTGQPQTQLQVIEPVLSGRQDVATAIAAPRWYVDHTVQDASAVFVESRLPGSLIASLEDMGHMVTRLGPWEDLMGHAQMIHIQPDGALVGAADPRSDPGVAGW